MAQTLKVTSKRVEAMQKDPEEYLRRAREIVLARAAAQLKAEQQQQAKRNYSIKVRNVTFS